MKNSLAFPHLMECDLLADLPDDQKIAFVDVCALRRYTEPTEILSQGELCSGFFIVAQGLVEVNYCDSQGNLSVVHVAAPGDILGDVEAISGNACAASCMTLPNSALLFCPTPVIYTYLQSPVFIRNQARLFYERLQRDNRAKSVSQFYSADERLYIHLCQLTNEKRPEIRVNQSNLAGIVGCSRQTVNRKLGELRDEGVVRLGKGKIKVMDRAGLERRVAMLHRG
ncbi:MULTISPECIES: Crp/Fnr family transcriptional regulator [unclassified Mesorhizobium]|uniref:Crp/Fnr family transcriptional regulator n=1 Tax=unclassified Mesorhizobium TaxID=325217 RepID=UPI0013E385E8|nr:MULTISPECIES: Crp/Fnr family transcriptional regulator [unclassified Mesorhizobium]